MSTDYRSEAQQRILRTLMCLFGNEIHGLSASDVAQAVETTPSNTTRDLANLQLAGLAELQPETRRWRLTPRLPQRALAMMLSMDKAEQKLQEIKNRYTRRP